MRVSICKAIGSEPDKIQQFAHSFASPCLIPAGERRNETDVPLDREVWKQPAFLNHVAGATSQRDRIPCCCRFALNQNIAGRWCQQTIDEFQSGSFAAA